MSKPAALCCLVIVILFAGSSTTQLSAGVIVAVNSTTANVDRSFVDRSVTILNTHPQYGNGVVTDVNIAVNFAKADGEAFNGPYPGGTPFYNEIELVLSRLSGPSVILIARNSWGSGSGMFDGTITFDQSASQIVNFGPAPVAGTFRPTGSGSLNMFNGSIASGPWTLRVRDTTLLDSLRFRSFTLTITTQSVPEPASFAATALTAVALAAARRYRASRSRKDNSDQGLM